MTFLQLLAGFLLLVAGGELLVRGAVALASRLGVSPLLIGLTLVGFGTSTPELITSVQAALLGSPGIAVGNVVGSNIANILLILGLSALIFPLVTTSAMLRRDAVVMAGAAVIFAVIAFQVNMGLAVGVVFIGLLLGYVLFSYWRERREVAGRHNVHEAEAAFMDNLGGHPGLGLSLVMAIGGLVLTLAGARFLVQGAITLAGDFGISETVIGLTVVAVGTSLPELVTSVMAAVRRQSDVALGNIVGSNIFNILGILGVTAIIQPIPIPAQILSFDIWVMLAVTALLILFATTGLRICRREGAVMLALYVGYVGWLAAQPGT